MQRGFLECLQQVLPTGRKIVVVTDAGFGRSWFDDVTACGLHFVGRLTRNNTLRPDDAAQALRVHDLFAGAGIKPRSVGCCMVTRDRPIEATVVVQRMKNKSRHRPKFRTRGLNPNSALHECYKRRAHEPWVLACSAHELSASCISRIYASRMRCEQAFRDGKNLRFGLGLGHVSVRQTERLHVLLLLVALALWAASLLGCLGEHAGAAKPLQANTVKTRRAFSVTVLGLLILEHKFLFRSLAIGSAKPSPSFANSISCFSSDDFVGIHQTWVRLWRSEVWRACSRPGPARRSAGSADSKSRAPARRPRRCLESC